MQSHLLGVLLSTFCNLRTTNVRVRICSENWKNGRTSYARLWRVILYLAAKVFGPTLTRSSYLTITRQELTNGKLKHLPGKSTVYAYVRTVVGVKLCNTRIRDKQNQTELKNGRIPIWVIREKSVFLYFRQTLHVFGPFFRPDHY